MSQLPVRFTLFVPIILFFQVHRDVKSENVLIDSNGYCLLADMGLAAVCELQSDQSQDEKGKSTTWHSPPISKRENHLLNPKEGAVVRKNRCYFIY
jgi:serine/threonine protein kinase